MNKNQIDNYEIVKLRRDQFHGAEYNPRKISESARKKLKAKIQKFGLVMPIVVNKRSMNIVGGHQRVSALDSIFRKQDYELQAAMVDVDEKEEIELNVILNNESIQGEWDSELLAGLKDIAPDLDYKIDLGFDQLDLDHLFSGTDQFSEMAKTLAPTEEQKEVANVSDKMRELKKEYKEKQKEQNETGSDTHWTENDNYLLTFVFNSNEEKRLFMGRIKKPNSEKYLKSNVLFDIVDDKFKF